MSAPRLTALHANALSCVAPVGDARFRAAARRRSWRPRGLLAPDALVVYMHDPRARRGVPDAVTAAAVAAAGLRRRHQAQELARERYVHRYTVNGEPFEMDGVVWRLRRAG